MVGSNRRDDDPVHTHSVEQRDNGACAIIEDIKNGRRCHSKELGSASTGEEFIFIIALSRTLAGLRPKHLCPLTGQYCDEKDVATGLTNSSTNRSSEQTSVPGHVLGSSGRKGSFVTCSAHARAALMTSSLTVVATSMIRNCEVVVTPPSCGVKPGSENEAPRQRTFAASLGVFRVSGPLNV